MNKQFLKDSFGWGFVLWLIGYALGFVFFFLMPPTLIGWVIMPIGIVITIWVLINKIRGENFPYYMKLAVIWTLIAVVCDYLFLVQLLKPEDGYYKVDVYLYYLSTLLLPNIIYFWKKNR